jgi:quinol monooxygenase YgiN
VSFTLVYDFEARDGKADELLGLLISGRDFGRTVEGCESFEVYQGAEEPHRFVIVETWTSPDAQQAHFEANVVPSGVLDKVGALVVGPIQPSSYVRR